jgi:ankyrin repeat protein
MIRQRAQDTDYTDPIIIQSAEYGHLLLLEFLYSIGVNIHQARSADFPSPLHAAVEGQKLLVVKWLIQHGANCNTRYSDGQTPLFCAVAKGSLDIVRALVEEGHTLVDIRNDNGRTVIYWVKEYTSVSTDRSMRSKILGMYLEITYEETIKYLQERCKASSIGWQ